VTKFYRDLETCSAETDAGLYVSLQDTGRELVSWSHMGSIPTCCLDNAFNHPNLIKAAIISLVQMVNHVREYITNMDDSTKKLSELQDRLQSWAEGTLQRKIKELISSANSTLLHAKDMERQFIADLLETIGRRPTNMSLVAKRTNKHPGKKRAREVTNHIQTVNNIQNYYSKTE